MRNIAEINFCPYTLVFFRFTERDKKVFNFIYPFQTVYGRVNQTVFTVCFDCQDLVVKDYNSQASCFQRYFAKKRSYLGFSVKFYSGRENRHFILSWTRYNNNVFFLLEDTKKILLGFGENL